MVFFILASLIIGSIWLLLKLKVRKARLKWGLHKESQPGKYADYSYIRKEVKTLPRRPYLGITWAIVKSVIFVICYQMKSLLSLFLSVLLIAQVELGPADLILLTWQVHNYLLRTAMFFLCAVYVLADLTVLLIRVNRRLYSPFQTAVHILSHRAWLPYRVFVIFKSYTCC